MKRTKQSNKPDAILTSDWHLREDTPTCRTDNYWEAQWAKVDFIASLQRQSDCPVLHAGDLFHHWKPSPYLLSETINHLPDDFYTVYGQHDLPQHNLELAYKCGINTLVAAGFKARIFPGGHWGQDISKARNWEILGRNITVWHKMVWLRKKLWPDQTDPPAKKLLQEYPKYDLIVTGDNHQPFIEEYEGRLLINPGSIMRMTAKQDAHRPRVYLWYAHDNKVVLVYIPVSEGVVTREHIEQREERDERIDAFISRLDDDWEAAVGFEENLKRFAEKNQIHKSVMEIIIKAIEI